MILSLIEPSYPRLSLVPVPSGEETPVTHGLASRRVVNLMRSTVPSCSTLNQSPIENGRENKPKGKYTRTHTKCSQTIEQMEVPLLKLKDLYKRLRVQQQGDGQVTARDAI